MAERSDARHDAFSPLATRNNPDGLVAIAGHCLSLRLGIWRKRGKREHRHHSGQIVLFGDAANCELNWQGHKNWPEPQACSGAQVWIVPPGVRHSARNRSATPLLVIYPAAAFWKEMTSGIVVEPSLIPFKSYVFTDSLIGEHTARFWKIVRTGELPGPIYLEYAAGVLSALIMYAHLGPRQRERKSNEGLPAAVLAKVVAVMRERYAENLTRRELAGLAGVSPWHFTRLFRASTSMTPTQYVNDLRVETAKRLLKAGGRTAFQVAIAVGYCDAGQLGLHFKRKFGITPGRFAQRR